MRGNRKREDNPKSFMVKVCVGAAVSVTVYFALVALYAFISLKTGAVGYFPAGIAAGALSGVIGGFSAVRPMKEKGALYGALSGLIAAFLCAAVMFVVNGNKAGNGVFILMASIITGSVAGGIFAVNFKFKKKY